MVITAPASGIFSYLNNIYVLHWLSFIAERERDGSGWEQQQGVHEPVRITVCHQAIRLLTTRHYSLTPTLDADCVRLELAVSASIPCVLAVAAVHGCRRAQVNGTSSAGRPEAERPPAGGSWATG